MIDPVWLRLAREFKGRKNHDGETTFAMPSLTAVKGVKMFGFRMSDRIIFVHVITTLPPNEEKFIRYTIAESKEEALEAARKFALEFFKL